LPGWGIPKKLMKSVPTSYAKISQTPGVALLDEPMAHNAVKSLIIYFKYFGLSSAFK